MIPALWPHQIEAADATDRELAVHRSTLVVAATGCLAGDTVIELNRAGKSFRMSISQVVDMWEGAVRSGKVWDRGITTTVRGRTDDGLIRLLPLGAAVRSGRRQTWTVCTEGGRTIRATADHRFLMPDGWRRLGELNIGDAVFVDGGRSRQGPGARNQYSVVASLRFHPLAGRRRVTRGGYSVAEHRIVMEAALSHLLPEDFIERARSGMTEGLVFLDPRTHHVHHRDENPANNCIGNLAVVSPEWHRRLHARRSGWQHVIARSAEDRIAKIELHGDEETFDLCMAGEPHNFLANGFVVHNSGKTTTGAEVVRRRRRFGRALWLAHREELIGQAARRIRSQTGLAVGVEMAGDRAGNLEHLDAVVATVQTLAREKRRSVFAPDAFDLVVVDEAHHAPAKTYRSILDHFPGAKILGLTATPDRGDGVAMARVFESTAHVYEIRDAIRDGFLCPVRQRAIHVEGFDLSRVRTTAGDLNEGDLEQILLDPDLLRQIAAAIVDAAGERPTMVFAVTVAHAHALAATLNGFEPESARACDGGTDGDLRKQTLEDFAAGRFKRLVNCALWTEGFDEPSISCVAVVRPTKSRAFYAQMAGRGMRILEGKGDCLILDFQGNAGRHTLACPLDVLGGADVDPEVKKKATAKMAERPSIDLLAALEEAARELAAERRQKLLSLANYRAIEVDPFELAQVVLGVPAGGGDGGRLEENLSYLARHARGLAADKMKPAQVAAVAGALRARQAAGRASWAQARCLMRAGLRADLDFATAAAAVEALAANGWIATPALRAKFGPLSDGEPQHGE